MSVTNAAYPRSFGPGTSVPYRTSNYTSQYGQDTHRYPYQDSVTPTTQYPRDAVGYSNQYPVGNAGDHDASRDYYHPIAPSLDSRISQGPRNPAGSFDGYPTKQIQYGQPLRVIAGNGVAGQPLGDYGSQVKSLYEAQQSDDDYQRHNADRNRREGRAQDRYGQRNLGKSKMNRYFLNGEGIDVDVLQREICKFLGSEATARPATHNVCTATICSFSEPR